MKTFEQAKEFLFTNCDDVLKKLAENEAKEKVPVQEAFSAAKSLKYTLDNHGENN
jgi:hypothetical protein